MPLFRKHLTPAALGGMIYELLRQELESSGELGIQSLLGHLELDRADMHNQYRGDIMISLMFAAVMAIERSTGGKTARGIISGMKEEFLTHLEEQGASPLQRSEWEATIASSFLLYRSALETYTGFEPPWKLGRQLYWNLVGEERYQAMAIKIATLYLMAGRDRVQDLLNMHGPLMLTERE